MVVTALEEELRDSLARYAEQLPAPRRDPGKLAEHVIRRARRIRRRRRWVGMSTTAAFVLLVGSALIYLPPGHGPAAPAAPVVAVPSVPTLLSPAAELPWITDEGAPAKLHGQTRVVPKLPVDLVADDRLMTADGSSIDVSFAGEVSQAYRLAEGWLVVGVPNAAARSSVWLVRAPDERQVLLSGVAGVAFDPARRRMAWRAGAKVFLATVDGGGLGKQLRSASVAGSAAPAGFVAGAVLIARGAAGGYDLWWPESGAYQEAWAKTAVTMYGGLADGRTAVGQVLADPAAEAGGASKGERRCLALFGVRTVSAGSRSRTQPLVESPLKTVCGLGLGSRSPGWVSPDGRWLLTGADDHTVLVDLAQLSVQPRVLSQGLPSVGGVAWLDDQTVVLTVGSGRAVMRLRLDGLRAKQADSVQQWSIPVVPNEGVLLVPTLHS